MKLDLDLGPDEVAIQDAVARFCARTFGKDRRTTGFTRKLWASFAEVGVLEACHPCHSGSAFHAAVALEVLGAAGFPGPLPHTVAAAAVLSDEDWAEVTVGSKLVTVGIAPVIPWASEAEIVLAIENGRVRAVAGELQPVDTLAATRSARVLGHTEKDRGPAEPVLARYDMAVAAWVQGAGRTALEAAAEHARTRRQFGKVLGAYQAVSFPLAEALMSLNAARTIVRFAAMAIDKRRADAPALAAAARLSACRAALKSCYSAHQVFGAAGQLTDGPVAWLSCPVQEYATQTRPLKTLRAELPLEIVSGLDLDAWAR